MLKTIKKQTQRIRRHARIRSRISGTAETPRLAVFKSNTHIYAQLIDDQSSKTLVASSTLKNEKGGVEGAKLVGAEIATKAKALGIEKVVFDRGGFIYTGAIRALADAARSGGLKF